MNVEQDRNKGLGGAAYMDRKVKLFHLHSASQSTVSVYYLFRLFVNQTKVAARFTKSKTADRGTS